ncbi:restriction endonuclease subunit S [Beggiatoa leptomitoformis]|uniref:Restriction endonuclease subunit S n=1 Tax=Beggiatoa leptomitoformis TaxID=288004 RepID=A0A2N9YIF3_9GAMM|nr:restriction endonuclease subunit S [Beggiatoa leptomitoformis]AUI70298.1 restriction endonuclease subunit S [Beggiatoa leptomitoformis]QGX03616.1 restriction endonuclease subunit S [Beggiatoa leptomitoformis]
MLDKQEMQKEWQSNKIEELCLKITSGGTPSRKNPSFYENGTINWIKTGELKDWYINSSSEKITLEAIDKSSAKIFPSKTVLLAMYGDGRTIGSLGILKHSAATNQACCAMILDETKCIPLFLFYSLMFNREKLISLALGGSQRNLNAKTIRNFTIKTPSIPTQQKIASILSAYDDLIENNTRRIQILEEMARRIYEEWFVHFRFPNHENIKLVESELGLIPEGWEVVALQSLYETASGGTPSRKNPAFFDGNINWVKTQELNDGFIFETNEKITEEGLKSSSAKLFQKETVLVAMYGATIGALGILDFPSTTNQACCAIISSKKFFGFEYAFLTLLVRRTELIELRAGAAQQNINQITVKNFRMLKPNLTTLSLFNEIANPILKQVRILQKKNNILRKIRDLLLPKLISGEIDVSEFPDP